MSAGENKTQGKKRKSDNPIPEGKEDGKYDEWNQLLSVKGFLRSSYYSAIIDILRQNLRITAILARTISRELIVQKKQTFRYMDFVFRNAIQENSGFNHLLKQSGQAGADFRRVYTKMDPKKLIEILDHPDMWGSICRYDPKAAFKLIQKHRNPDLFKDFKDWLHGYRDYWKYTVSQDKCLRADVDRAKKCTELGLCQNILINRERAVTMTTFPITEEIVQIKLQIHLEPLQDIFNVRIYWDDLWEYKTQPEISRLLETIVCDRDEKPDRDDVILEILGHMLREGRRETVDLWDNLCHLPFSDEKSIFGYMLRELLRIDYHNLILMLEYLFPRHMYLNLRNNMRYYNTLYSVEIGKRLHV